MDDGKIKKGDGFPDQRFVSVPARVIERSKELSVVNNLYITQIGAFPIAPQHYLERPAGSNHAIFIYCMNGSGLLHIADTTFDVGKADALLIPPNQPHIYQASEDDPWSLFWIHFDGSMVRHIFDWLELDSEHPLLHLPDTNLMHRLFENLFACLKYDYSNADLLAMSCELLHFIGNVKMNALSEDTELRQKMNRIDETIVFMKEHLDMTLSLEDLARQAGQSVSVYRKRFRQKTGETPINFHIQLKISKACELLDNTDMHIGDIAALLGYEDSCYFSRYFKNVQGCSPSSYRESIKG